MGQDVLPVAIILLVTCFLCKLRTFILGIGKHNYLTSRQAKSPTPSARPAGSWAAKSWALARHARESSRFRVVSNQHNQKSAHL
jgi:hypothetical protein